MKYTQKHTQTPLNMYNFVIASGTFFLITNKKKNKTFGLRNISFSFSHKMCLILFLSFKSYWFMLYHIFIYTKISRYAFSSHSQLFYYFVLSLSLSLPTIWMALALLYWSWNNEKNNNDKTTTFAWCLFQLERNKQCKQTFVHVIHLDVDVKFKAEVNVTSELLLIEIFMIFFLSCFFIYI